MFCLLTPITGRPPRPLPGLPLLRPFRDGGSLQGPSGTDPAGEETSDTSNCGGVRDTGQGNRSEAFDGLKEEVGICLVFSTGALAPRPSFHLALHFIPLLLPSLLPSPSRFQPAAEPGRPDPLAQGHRQADRPDSRRSVFACFGRLDHPAAGQSGGRREGKRGGGGGTTDHAAPRK